MITIKVITENRACFGVYKECTKNDCLKNNYKQKMVTCQEQSTQIITVKPKNELNNFRFFVHKMTAQSFKLEKFMTSQAANLFGHVR